MITISREKGIHIEGNTSDLISEVGALIHAVAKEISEKNTCSCGKCLLYEDIVKNMNDAASLGKLVKSGMTSKDAIEVLGLTNIASNGMSNEQNNKD